MLIGFLVFNNSFMKEEARTVNKILLLSGLKFVTSAKYFTQHWLAGLDGTPNIRTLPIHCL